MPATSAGLRWSILLPFLLLGIDPFPGSSSPFWETRRSPSEGEVQDTFPPYLGQPRPGAEPELFGRGIISTDAGMYGTVVFSPRGDEAFWVTDQHPGLFFSCVLNGRWTAPEEFPFRAGYRLNSPVFSADGRTLYFLAAIRGSDGTDQDDRIWMVERDGDRWGEPREMDPRVNSVPKHFQFSVDGSGSVYFGGEGADLYVAEWRNGTYFAPERLPAPLNTTAPEMSPQIAPDGSYLLFDRFFDSPPWVRIMLSFRKPDGGWTEPRDLSPYTRSEGNDSGARLSPDGRYLFFQSVRAGSDPNRSIYWMEAGFLEELGARATASAGVIAPTAPPYLGEVPPGSTPKPIAPELFTRELHSSPVFSPREELVFWNEMEGGTIQCMLGEDGAWSEPRVAPFTLPYSGEPCFAPDGGTLYFLSAHRTEGSRSGFDENVWRVNLGEEGWSDPELLGGPVNDQPMHWGVSLAANGTLYLGQTDGSGDIWVSESRYGRYQDPMPLGPGVNSADMETTPEVAPDESFLVFARVVDNGRGPVDLYVSFRDPDGVWMPAVPLAAVNTSEREISPRLSPDGKYLFFLRSVDGELRPFWVSARVVTDLRPR